jgi:hypothetical protein
MASTGVNAGPRKIVCSSAGDLAELALFLDLIWTLRPGPEGTPRERPRAENQLISMLRTALDRL